LATRRLRPEVYKVSMDFENLVAGRGDTVMLAYDTIFVGQRSGRIKSIDGFVIGLDEDIFMETGTDYTMRVRTSSNEQVVLNFVASLGIKQSITLLSNPTKPIAVGDLFVFGETGKESIEAKIVTIEYNSDFSADLELVDAAQAIFSADTGVIPDYDPHMSNPVSTINSPHVPTISYIVATRRLVGAIYSKQLLIGFSLKSGSVQASSIEVEYKIAATPEILYADMSSLSLTINDAPIEGTTVYVKARSKSISGLYSEWTNTKAYTISFNNAEQEAIDTLEDWAADGIFSPFEKQSFKSGWDIRLAEYIDVRKKATGLEELEPELEDLRIAFKAWGTYLNDGEEWFPPTTDLISDSIIPEWLNAENISLPTPIDRIDFVDYGVDYFTALTAIKDALLNKQILDADGQEAVETLIEWAKDDVFSPIEKKAFKDGWAIRVAEYFDVKSKAILLTGLSIEIDSLCTAFTAWGMYLNGGDPWTPETVTPLLWLNEENI